MTITVVNKSGKIMVVNYVIDVPKMAEFFYNDYFNLKEVISMYVAYLIGLHVQLSTSIDSEMRSFTGPDLFVSLLQMEKPTCNKFYDSMSRNIFNEKIAYEMIDYHNVFPRESLREIFDTIHDAINVHVRNIVIKVSEGYESYIGKTILTDALLLNHHTVMVTFKTIRLSERVYEK